MRFLKVCGGGPRVVRLTGMKARIAAVLALFALLLAGPARAQAPAMMPCSNVSEGQSFRGNLDSILARGKSLRGARLSVQLARAPTGEVLYEKNPDLLLVPASVAKVVTGAAALVRLGQAYEFSTELYGELSADGARIEGPLYIKGYGDPWLVTERLVILADSFRGRGIQEIQGDLVVDESFFDQVRYNESWKGAEESDDSYVASTGALSVNFNAITAVVRPGRGKGDPAVVASEPVTAYVEIENKVKTGGEGTGTYIEGDRASNEGRVRLALRGRIALGARAKRIYKNVEDPAAWAGTLIEVFFEQQGIQVKGRVRAGVVPEGAPLLDRLGSQPLPLVLRDLNKYSNNFVAEQIVKTLGALDAGPPGTWEKGLAVLDRFLREIGAPEGGWRLRDGSGLSPQDRLSAHTLVHVLAAVFQDHRIRPDYEAGLSVGGADGTVRKRFRDDPLLRRVRAKTGHLAGVSSLAGYFYPVGAPPVAFAVIVNGFSGGFAAVEADVDAFVAEALRACGAGGPEPAALPLGTLAAPRP